MVAGLFVIKFSKIHGAQIYPGINPYFPQMAMPYYPHGMIPHMPLPYAPYFAQYPPPILPGMVQSPFMNPSYSTGPGAGSIAAALNLPATQNGMYDENIAGQLGGHVQLPGLPKDVNIPSGLLSAKAPQPKSPQIGSSPITMPISNTSEKTAPLPVLY